LQPDLYWNHEDHEQGFGSIGEVIDHTCDSVEPGSIIRIDCAATLAPFHIRIIEHAIGGRDYEYVEDQQPEAAGPAVAHG
jgi:hypothetical protein